MSDSGLPPSSGYWGQGPPGGELQPGVYVVSSIPSGGYYWYQGKQYRLDNGAFYNMLGERAWLPIEFSLSAFANVDSLHMGYFAGLNQSTPLMVNPSARRATVNPVGTASQHLTLDAVAVTGYQAKNTTMDVHIFDQSWTGSYGNWTYGDSLLDPAWPPMLIFRHYTTENEDVVTTPNSLVGNWTDKNVGTKSIPETREPTFDVNLRIENEPMPHWVISVYYGDLFSTGYANSVTWLAWLIGPALPISNPSLAYTFTYGSAGVPGHFKIWRQLALCEPPPQHLQIHNGANHNDSFNNPALFHDHTYVAANSGNTIYLTDTGLTGGTSLFKNSGVVLVPPAVLLSGSTAANTDHGSTITSWKCSSQGCGNEYDGVVTDSSPAASIQHPNTDEWCSFSLLGWNGSRWSVGVWNRSGVTNRAGSARTSISRHFVVHAFGPEYAP